MTTENLVYWLLRVVLAVGAVFILWKLVTWWVELESEAREQNKRIELAVLLIVLISLGISVTDHRVDPVADQADITIRVGDLADSTLVAVPLGSVSRVIAASPAYLAAHGEPKTPQELIQHECLLLRGFPQQAIWPFRENGKPVSVKVRGQLASDSAETLLRAAVSGAGIIRLGDFLGAEALASGQLVPLLTRFHETGRQPITALVQPGRQSLPRIRAILGFLKSHT